MAVNQEKIREHIRGILEAIGEDPEREGLRDRHSRPIQIDRYGNDDVKRFFQVRHFLNPVILVVTFILFLYPFFTHYAQLFTEEFRGIFLAAPGHLFPLGEEWLTA